MNTFSVYDTEEIKQYFDRINFPYTDINKIQPNLETLLNITRCHKLAIPFGALDLFYYDDSFTNMYSGIDVDPMIIFNKMVLNKREGYCIEHAILLDGILKYVGFKGYITYASVINHDKRKNGIIEYSGNFHFINVITVDKCRFVVDVGFIVPGVPCANPIDKQNPENPKHRITKIRSAHEITPFVYESNDVGRFLPYYIFYTIPYTLDDIKKIVYYADHNVESVFDRDLIISKLTKSGHVSLFNTTLTIEEHDETTHKKIDSEEERRKVFRELFGIKNLKGSEHLPKNMKSNRNSIDMPSNIFAIQREKYNTPKNNLPKQFILLNNFINLKTNHLPRL